MFSIRRYLGLVALCLWLPPVVFAQQAPVWQPYRSVNPPLAAADVVVTDTPHLPVDALLDSDLEVLCPPCPQYCQPQYCQPQYCQPQYVHTHQYTNAPYGDPVLAPLAASEAWSWHLMPNDLIWHSYLGSAKEPRISGTWFEELQDDVSLLDVTLGGRSSILRYGTYNEGRSEGWELQLEGAAILRLNLDFNWDLDLVDYRFGVPVVYGYDRHQWKFAYYHLSSHLGDELIIREDNLDERINYSRDVLVIAYSFFPVEAVRIYGEMGYAFVIEGGSEPWEFQFGIDYAQPGPTGACGTPFFAINGHLREEVNFGGNLALQAGWLWRGKSGKVLRTGLHYYNGKSPQFETFDEFEHQIGVGLWHDF